MINFIVNFIKFPANFNLDLHKNKISRINIAKNGIKLV